MKLILVLIVLSFSGVLLAQETPTQRLIRLERRIISLEQRIRSLELIVTTPIPEPVPYTYWACSVTNTYNGTVYMGKDSSQEGARAKARNDCLVYSHTPNYCAEPACEQVTE